MYQGKNAKIYLEEIQPSVIGNFKVEKVQDVLQKFIADKNVLNYTITKIYRDSNHMLLTIVYED